ncbi:MAG TPA: PhoH family protein [Candidatus Aminicenantes bacterium]|nr:PhoH family protein [Candidatus Aminicenantes bacterium]
MDELTTPESLDPAVLKLFEKHSKDLETAFQIHLSIRGTKLMFNGPKVNRNRFRDYVEKLFSTSRESGGLTRREFELSLNMAQSGRLDSLEKEMLTPVSLRLNGREVFPRTLNQKRYLEAMQENTLTFGIGPAGTGKTYLAIAAALQSLFARDVDRIVLTRPVVEAGEKLGFLPGDIQQKVNPYFRPLYDALYDLIGFEKTADLIDREIIEIAPLAYMRGRTINNAFVILDEGQNTLSSQMKMFLTRFGANSRVVVTADISQIDLADPRKSGIFRAIKILNHIQGIRITTLTARDVVRHPLVRRIIDAYDQTNSQ